VGDIPVDPELLELLKHPLSIVVAVVLLLLLVGAYSGGRKRR
jgi:hypothetical protein